MSNPFYTASGNPLPQSRGLSSQVRNEFAAIQSGFDAVAPTNSPAFTGTPTAPTPAPGTASTAVATTAFVMSAALDANIPGQTGNAGKFLSTDGANPIWAHSPSGYSARTSNTVLGAADKGNLIDITSGTFVQTLTAAATLGDRWWCHIRNSGSGDITLNPNASETIEGMTSLVLRAGETRMLTCNGSGFYGVLVPSYVAPVAAGNLMTSDGTKWVSSPPCVAAQAIGAYVIGWGGAVTAGQSVAGASIQIVLPHINSGIAAGGDFLVGTWRAMTACDSNHSTLFQRIA